VTSKKKLFMSIRASCDLHKKSLFLSIRRHYLQIKACWTPFLLRFSGSFRRFSELLPGFYGIFPGFSPN